MKRLLSEDWAPMPTTMPSTPADAIIEAPSVRIGGKVRSMAATATKTTIAVTARWIRVTWVRTRRTRASSWVTAA